MILGPYGGPGGWAEGLATHGLTETGIEWDPDACRTRTAAGHRTIRADVTRFPLAHLAGRVRGVIMSPPCQAFSTAGGGEGRADIARLCADVYAGHWGGTYPEKVRHVLEVGRWVDELRPEWLACEQVPPVLPVWEAYAHRLRALGYSVWSGILNAADYGVPQTRQRAILMASRVRKVTPPSPTHAPAVPLFGDLSPWVTMDDAIGWGFTDRPARTICGDRSPRWLYPDRDGTHGRVLDRRTNSKAGRGVMVATVPVPTQRPAPTVTSGCLGQWVWIEDGERRTLTTGEALTLQGFHPDYPVQGNRSQVAEQIANAVPPPLAARILEVLV